MIPHLHPRSRLTTSLFGTTLLVSFLVVGMPHIFPCPAPRVKFADGDFEISEDGKRRRRRRPQAVIEGQRDGEVEEKLLELEQHQQDEDVLKRKNPHECPVPKPRGLIGEVLGFTKEVEEKEPRPSIETLKAPKLRKDDP